MALTLNRLKTLLHYDPLSGAFTWRVRTSNRIAVGDVAGTKNAAGYVSISIDGKLHRANRLAWLYVTGEWPVGDVDHKNGVRHENWFANLRDTSRSVNLQNQRRARTNNQSSGLLGVSASLGRAKRWRASIKAEGKAKHLGRFATKEEAQEAYLAAKRDLHQGCTI